MIARVLIDGPSELVFDYVIPEGLAVVAGCRVRVPIRQKTSSGTVLSVTPPPEQSEFAMREVKSLIDPEPLITPVLLKTAHWIAGYYGSSIEGVIRSILPESVRTEDNSAKTRRIAIAAADPDPEALAKLEKRAAKQHVILTLLLHAPDRTLAVADLGENSAPSLKSLAEKVSSPSPPRKSAVTPRPRKRSSPPSPSPSTTSSRKPSMPSNLPLAGLATWR